MGVDAGCFQALGMHISSEKRAVAAHRAMLGLPGILSPSQAKIPALLAFG
ncbi:hypothetical protein PT974_08692 [Cladobotryum mycophilum]|uniref:Uncharacterized protein n=1 Tax=Cladobotryum mycophilum TaxID=491253 RepID=A0ABR0SEM2_9HYPO